VVGCGEFERHVGRHLEELSLCALSIFGEGE
jgi:hypothetical protein